MNPVKKMIGDYKDEVKEQVEKAKTGGPAKSSEKIVKNIV